MIGAFYIDQIQDSTAERLAAERESKVSRNVKRWRNAEMALRWTATGILVAQKSFHRLKAYRPLSILGGALQDHMRKAQAGSAIETIMKAA